MQKLSKLIFILFLVLTIATICLIPRYVKADENAIPDPFVPCTDQGAKDTDGQQVGWKNPEFSSLRPYQASPCGDSPKAYYCSNDYIIEEKATTEWKTNKCGYPEMICPYSGGIIERDYEIGLSNIKLPILGNTEETANSQNLTEKIDDAQKMNEYLTWYLSGATQKAEQGNDTTDDTLNFAGPIKKLLPSAIQDFQRFTVLHDAGVALTYNDSEDTEGSPRDTDPNKAGVQADETFNHNQIVVCTTKNVRILGFDIYNPWVGQEQPIPCYEGQGNKSKGTSYRMLQWWEGKQSGLIDSLKVIEGWDGSQRWGHTVPPFPWQFEKSIYYEKAYREWRGHECLLVFEKLLCADLKIPGVVELHTNKWADFYQYIPLGTPADKNASHLITGVNIEGLGGTRAERPTDANGNSESGTYFIEQNPILYYPHAKASDDMLKILNKTLTPEGLAGEKGQRPGGESPTQEDFEAGKCEIADVGINNGDSLTFKNVTDKQRAVVRDIKIEVTQVGCLNKAEIRDFMEECGGVVSALDPNCDKNPSCDGVVQVVIKSTPKIPYADQIWNKAVVGPASSFRKIFPKIEEGAPVSCIADIPGVSDVDYAPTTQTNLIAVVTPDGKKGPDGAELFFPHLGTVYEYFLKGIQTALRPKGYGEPIVNGKLCETSVACGDWESKLGGSGGACGICNAPIGDLAKKILTAAGTAYQVPAANIWAAMKHEGADWAEFNGQFTDENVRKWSNSESCGGEPMPKCDNNADVTQPPFGFLKKWFYLGEGTSALWSAVQAIDPSRDTPEKVSRCNFLDAAFATAKLLRQGSSNTSTSAGISCGAYNFDTTQPASCSSWTDTKIAQSQVGHMGQCPETSPYGPVPFTIADVVNWYKDAKCN